MVDRNRNYPDLDPAASVLLDFQSVMAEFLDVQAGVLEALRRRRESPVRMQPARIPVTPQPIDIPVPSAMPASQAPQAGSVIAPIAPARERDDAPARAERPTFSRHTLTVRERPAGKAAPLAAGHAVIVTDDGRGVGRLVASRLRGEGRRVALISTADGEAPQDGVFVSLLDSAEETERIVRLVIERCGPVAALVHAAALSNAPDFERLDAGSWWNRLSSETRAFFLLARSLSGSLEAAGRKGGASVIAATCMGGAFGTETAGTPILPTQGGVVGFAKCLAVEWPDVRVRAVDLDLSEPAEALAQHLVDELLTNDESPEIGYVKGRRVAVETVHTPVRPDPAFALPGDAVILATGGARGITAEVCLDLAERYQPTFVLVGQSPMPPAVEPADVAALTTSADLKRALAARLQTGGARVTPAVVEKAYRQLQKEREIRETISRLSAAGARTHYVQLDVQDEQAFGALIEEVYATYGRLDGVLHGAGIIEDKLVRDKPVESFDRVLRTKTLSAFTLSRHLRPESLRFLVFFSSVAGRFGNRGQADYAASNEVVSKLAAVLQKRWPARVCSIAWAPWDKLGMVSPELKREFARRGVELLAPEAGRRALWQEIQQSSGAAAEVVIGGSAVSSLVQEATKDPLPLLKHSKRDTAGADAVRFVRDLDPTVDIYLRDHRLDGTPVLPLAFATELMAEAAQAAWPDLRVVAVKNLQLLKGIVVDAPVTLNVTVRSSVHSDADGLTEVHVDISTPSLTPAPRYRAVVQLDRRDAEAPAFEVPAWPLVRLSKSLEGAYRDWTFHGPLFQRITHLAGIGADCMLGTVYSSSSIPALSTVQRPDWIIDPFVFDAALQLLLMWSRAQNDMTALPSRFQSFTRYRPLSDEPLTCYVGVKSLAGGHALKSNVHFVDGSGRLLAALETMEASCTSALNRLAGGDACDEARS